jgi:hypothetical protein
MMTAKSAWDTGTYELLLERDPEGGTGDLMVVVFARPLDPEEDIAADEDAPILALIEVSRLEYEEELQDWQLGLRTIGEQGLLRPESVESIFGPRLGVRILLALEEACDRDFRGVDLDGAPWRMPSAGAFPLLQRTHEVAQELGRRLFGT